MKLEERRKRKKTYRETDTQDLELITTQTVYMWRPRNAYKC
jgi:hypothetical protein